MGKTTGVVRRRRIAGQGSPLQPRFAFEWFQDRCCSGEGVSTPSLSELARMWKALADDERAEYVNMAEQDRERFEQEYEVWRLEQSRKGICEPRIDELIDQRRAVLERKLARLDGEIALDTKEQEGSTARVRTRKRGGSGEEHQPVGVDDQPKKAKRLHQPRRLPVPADFPERSKSDFGHFCREMTSGVLKPSKDQEVEVGSATDRSDAGITEGRTANRGFQALRALRRAWQELDQSERRRYAELAAKDEERFRVEVAAWRQQHPDTAVPEGSARFKMPRTRLPTAAEISLAAGDGGPVMSEVLRGAALLGLEDAQRQRRASSGGGSLADPGLESGSVDAVTGMLGSVHAPGMHPASMPPDTTVDDLLGELVAAEEEPDSWEDHGHGIGSGLSHSLNSDRQVSTGAEFGAVASLNSFHSAGAEQSALWTHDQFQAVGYPSETPLAGTPRVLGPQLCLDESGNIILNKSSLSQGLDEEVPVDDRGPVQESMTQYSSAYRRTAAAKWSDAETEMFYEALALYGTDLFLVQTFFRNKSAAQIKSKFQKELKKHPAQVQEVLTTRAKPLTKKTFEDMHGKIDTSKHYKPPPSPLPGEGHEGGGVGHGDGDLDADMDEPYPPPDPEFSAEDESLTTNRLMALFD